MARQAPLFLLVALALLASFVLLLHGHVGQHDHPHPYNPPLAQPHDKHINVGLGEVMEENIAMERGEDGANGGGVREGWGAVPVPPRGLGVKVGGHPAAYSIILGEDIPRPELRLDVARHAHPRMIRPQRMPHANRPRLQDEREWQQEGGQDDAGHHAPAAPRSTAANRPVGKDSGQLFSREDVLYLQDQLHTVSTMLKRLVLEHQGKAGALPAAPQRGNLEPVLAVMTLNLWGVGHEWESRRAAMARMLQAHPADILGVQEVHALDTTAGSQVPDGDGGGGGGGGGGARGGTQDEARQAWTQAHELARAIGYHHVTAALFPSAPSNKEPAEGLAVISRHPITYSRLHIFPRIDHSSDGNARGVLHAKVNLGRERGGVCDVFVTHLTYDDKAQCAMAVLLMDVVAQAAGGSGCIFLLGDFNT